MQAIGVALQEIVIDEEVIVRSEICEEHLEDLVEALKQSKKLPPVVVYNDSGTHILVDGRHRYEAAKICKKDKIEAVVHEGSKRQAILFACGVNSGHGLRRTNEDKRHAVTRLLTDQEWSKWTDGKIAKICAVSQVFASKVRNELIHNGFEFSQIRTGLGNKSYKTFKKKINKSSGPPSPTNEITGEEDDTNNSVENEGTTGAKEQPIHTDKEISEVGAAIYNLNKKMVKLNTLIQKKKKWSKERKAKAREIKEAIDHNFVTICKFLVKIIN